MIPTREEDFTQQFPEIYYNFSAMETTKRNLDETTSSLDILAMNNTVVSMRNLTKRVKLQIIHKLTKQIKALKNKKGSEAQLVANKRKAYRFVREIRVLKNLDTDEASKFALGNTKTAENLGQLADMKERCLVRISTHKLMTGKVSEFRSKHDDWQALANFIGIHTGRRIKNKSGARVEIWRFSDEVAKPVAKKKMNKSDDEVVRPPGLVRESDPEMPPEGDRLKEEPQLKMSDDEVGPRDCDSKISPEDQTLQTDKTQMKTSEHKESELSEESDSDDDDAGDTDGGDADGGDADGGDVDGGDDDGGEEVESEKSEQSGEESNISDQDSDDDSDSEGSEEIVTSLDKPKADTGVKSNIKDEKSNTENSKSSVIRGNTRSTEDEEPAAKRLRSLPVHDRSQVVVKQFNLDGDEEEKEDQTSKRVFVDIQRPSLTKSKPKDSFFLGDSDDDDDDDDNDEQESLSGKQMEEDEEEDYQMGTSTTFVDSLSGARTSRHTDRNRRLPNNSYQRKPPSFRTHESGDRRQKTHQMGRGQQKQQFPTKQQEPMFKESDTEKLHPSWQASRKRKEQMTQIQAFQGKKITFDD